MDLKDVVLEVLADMQDDVPETLIPEASAPAIKESIEDVSKNETKIPAAYKNQAISAGIEPEVAEPMEEVPTPESDVLEESPIPKITQAVFDNALEDSNSFNQNAKLLEEINESVDEDFLHSVRERILVLFEGFYAPKNQNTEAKLDITLNFLEYLLSAIDERIDQNAHRR